MDTKEKAHHSESLPPYQPERERNTPARRRLVKWHPLFLFAIVSLTWLAYSYAKRGFGKPLQEWRWVGEMVEYDEGNDQCVASTNWTTYYDLPPWAPEFAYGAEATFSLPLDSNALYLVSRGEFQGGQVHIKQSSQVADTVDVLVRVAYHSDEALGRASVCPFERADEEHGVGIFTTPVPVHKSRRHPHTHRRPGPPYWPKDELEFDVTLTLPAASIGSLSVKKLETKMPNYDQYVADLQKSVLFGSILLASTNGQLNVQSVACEDGKFMSVNGNIEGRFVAKSSLGLQTVNGHITPIVDLLHQESGDNPRLVIQSVHGPIDAQLSLTSKDASAGGKFDVSAKSVNGNIGLTFSDTPLDSVLSCLAETTVGTILVELDSAFEGSYSLQSLIGRKLVSQQNVEDPTGKGRERVVSRSDSFGQINGDVKWVESDGGSSENEGFVTLKAVTGSIELVV